MATDQHKEWVRSVLGVSKVSKGTAGKKATTIDFSDEEPLEITTTVGKVTSGRTGEAEIEAQLVQLQIAIGDYWDDYKSGIEGFRDSMNFASEQEAESKYLSAIFTSLGKTAIEAALDAAGEALGKVVPGAGTVIKAAKGVAEAWMAETERVAAAAGQVQVKKYIAGLIAGIKPRRDEMRKAVENSTGPLLKEFKRLAASDNLKGKATDEGIIVGDAAAVVNGVKNAVAAFKAKSPAPSYFQKEFTRAFADTPGWTEDYASRGGRPAGRLYFEIRVNLETEDGTPVWSIDNDGTSKAWKLVTLREKPDRVAESLADSLGGAKPWEIDLEKTVVIKVNGKEGRISFRKSPDSYELNPHTLQPKLLEAAWKQPRIRSRVLDTAKLVGSNK